MPDHTTEFPRPERKRGANYKPERGTLLEWNHHTITVTRPWPNPAAWTKTRKKPQWRGCEREPLVNFELPEEPSLSMKSRVAAWSLIPEPVLEQLRRVPTNWSRWRMLVMLGRCPGAIELMRDVPLLALALTEHGMFRRKRVKRWLRSIRALLRAPNGMRQWRKIARWLRFDDSRSFVDVLRRASDLSSWTPWDLEHLVKAWNDPEIRKRLRHQPRLHADTAQLWSLLKEYNAMDRLNPDLHEQIHHQWIWSGFPGSFRRIGEAWRILWPDRMLPMFRTLEEIEDEERRVRAAIAERYLRPPATPAARPPTDFVEPPFPGNEVLHPMHTADDLIAEGLVMQHCIGGEMWAADARTGDGFGYRVHWNNERATLWIGRSYFADKLEIRQLQGPQNQRPSHELCEYVRLWFARWEQAVFDGEYALPAAWKPLDPQTQFTHVPEALRWALRPDLPVGGPWVHVHDDGELGEIPF